MRFSSRFFQPYMSLKDFSSIWIGGLTQNVNFFLELAGEKLRLKPRKVGAVLTSLGFSSRTRTNSGWVISLNRRDAEKLHQLAASYGIDGIRDGFQSIPLDECSLCRAARLGRNEPDSAPEEGVKRVEVDLRKKLKTHARS